MESRAVFIIMIVVLHVSVFIVVAVVLCPGVKANAEGKSSWISCALIFRAEQKKIPPTNVSAASK